MPIVAVAGAVGGAAALAGGGLTVLQTIAAIGSIVSGIGAITGSKTLMKIGGVASLAGGIGAFAQSKGWIATGSAAETAATATSSSNIEALKATPSGAEFNVGVDPTTATTPPNPFAQGAATEPASSMFDAAGDSTTTGLAGTADITSNISQASPEIAKTMGAPAAAERAPGGLADAKLPETAPKAMGAVEPPNQTGIETPQVKAPGTTPPNPMAPAGGTPPNPFAQAPKGGNKVLDLFNEFIRDKDGKLSNEAKAFAMNFLGGAFDDEKKARTDFYKTRAEIERKQMENASAVPAMDFHLKKAPGGTFRQTTPVHRPVRPVGLFNAR